MSQSQHNNEFGCRKNIGYGNMITYGNIPNGTPKAGDAYDCKLTKNGDYTERFYYLTSNGDNSTLIYYTDVNNHETYEYATNLENYHGPIVAYNNLPSVSEWNNPNLIKPGNRQLLTQSGLNNLGSGTIMLDEFSYGDKAARLLTMQEVTAACPSITSSKYSIGWIIDTANCNFLLENVESYEKGPNGYRGYWLENPYSSSQKAWRIEGSLANFQSSYVSYLPSDNTEFSVRPVITIKTASIEK